MPGRQRLGALDASALVPTDAGGGTSTRHSSTRKGSNPINAGNLPVPPRQLPPAARRGHDRTFALKSVARLARAAKKMERLKGESQRALEDVIGIDELEALVTIFVDQDGNGIELDENSFCDKIGDLLPPLKGSDILQQWFMRIDADATGLVGWEEFSSFLCSQGQQRSSFDLKGTEYVTTPMPSKGAHQKDRHTDLITCVVFHQKSDRIFTGSRDGRVKRWDAATMTKCLVVYNGSSWITSMAMTQSELRLVVCCVDRKVLVFDTKTCDMIRAFVGKKIFNTEKGTRFANEVGDVLEIKNSMDNRKFGLSLNLGSNGVSTSVVQAGKMVGGASSLPQFRQAMEQQRQHLAERKRIELSSLQGLEDVPVSCVTVPWSMVRKPDPQSGSTLGHDDVGPDYRCGGTGNTGSGLGGEVLVLGMRQGNLLLYDIPVVPSKVVKQFADIRVHTGHVSVLKASEYLKGVLSASWDCTIKITNLATRRVVKTFGGPTGHLKPVLSVDWSDSSKMLVSCGSERVVLVWNHLQETPIFRLEGHNAPLVGVMLNDENYQIVSLSQDRAFHVWDMRSYRCVQIFQERGDALSSVGTTLFDHRRKRIMAAGLYLIAYPMKQAISAFPPGYEGHTAPLLGALFYAPFQQLVSVDNDRMTLWDADSGENVFTFSLSSSTISRSVASEFRISCVNLDAVGRRLLTGTLQGVVVVWNYSNGQILNLIQDKGQFQGQPISAVASAVRQRDVIYFIGIPGNLLIAFHKENQFTLMPSKSIRLQPHSKPTTIVQVSDCLVAVGTSLGDIVLLNFVMMKIEKVLTMPLCHCPPGKHLRVERMMLYPKLIESSLCVFYTEGIIALWHHIKKDLAHVSRLRLPNSVVFTNFSLDEHGEYIAATDDFGNVHVFEIVLPGMLSRAGGNRGRGLEALAQWGSPDKADVEQAAERKPLLYVNPFADSANARLIDVTAPLARSTHSASITSLGRSGGDVRGETVANDKVTLTESTHDSMGMSVTLACTQGEGILDVPTPSTYVGGMFGGKHGWISPYELGGLGESTSQNGNPLTSPRMAKEDQPFYRVLYSWNAHHSHVTSVTIIRLLNEPAVITTCIDCSVKLFSLKGAQLGEFGVAKWSLNHLETWACRDPVPAYQPQSTAADVEEFVEEKEEDEDGDGVIKSPSSRKQELSVVNFLQHQSHSSAKLGLQKQRHTIGTRLDGGGGPHLHQSHQEALNSDSEEEEMMMPYIVPMSPKPRVPKPPAPPCVSGKSGKGLSIRDDIMRITSEDVRIARLQYGFPPDMPASVRAGEGETSEDDFSVATECASDMPSASSNIFNMTPSQFAIEPRGLLELTPLISPSSHGGIVDKAKMKMRVAENTLKVPEKIVTRDPEWGVPVEEIDEGLGFSTIVPSHNPKEGAQSGAIQLKSSAQTNALRTCTTKTSDNLFSSSGVMRPPWRAARDTGTSDPGDNDSFNLTDRLGEFVDDKLRKLTRMHAFQTHQRRQPRQASGDKGQSEGAGGGEKKKRGVNPFKSVRSTKGGMENWTERASTLLTCVPPKKTEFKVVESSGTARGVTTRSSIFASTMRRPNKQ